MKIHHVVRNTVSLEFSAVARTMANSGLPMISLGLGEPGFPTPPEVIDAAHRSMLAGETRYSSPWGVPELLEKIRTQIGRDAGTELAVNQVMVTMGAKQALSLTLMAVLEPGDEVIVLSPYFVSYIPQIGMAEPNCSIVVLPLAPDFSVDIEALAATMSARTKAVVVNFPNNPTGRILTTEQQRQIIDLCAERGAYLVADEIYSRFLIGGNEFESFTRGWSDYERIVLVHGFSKSYSMTGWRIGYLAGPRDLMQTACSLQQHLNTNVPVFVQRGAQAGMDLPEAFYSNYNQLLTENEAYLEKATSTCRAIQYVRAQGGMFAFLNIGSAGLDSDRFATDLLTERRVAATPGRVFGDHWDNHLRVSLGGDVEEFRVGIDALCAFAEERQRAV